MTVRGYTARTTEATRTAQKGSWRAGGQVYCGGPRGGKGAPTNAAICAATRGVKACASGWGSSITTLARGNGSVGARQSEQSSVCGPNLDASPSSSTATSLTLPSAEQTNSIAVGWTSCDAPATHNVSMNHARIRRASVEDVRMACITSHYRSCCAADRRRHAAPPSYWRHPHPAQTPQTRKLRGTHSAVRLLHQPDHARKVQRAVACQAMCCV